MPLEERRALDSMAQTAPSAGPGSGGGIGRGTGLGGGRTGESAVAYSKAENKMKGSDKIESLETYVTSVRSVGDKTFQLKGDEWIDTEFKDSSTLPKVEMQFGSDEFFNLIAREPKLAEFFSLGKRVTVVYKGRIYRITG